MIKKERLLNYKSHNDPFPVIEISNFLDQEECIVATRILQNTKYDEFVRLNRSNIRKGSKTSKRANGRIKTLLTMGAQSIIGTKSELAIYYYRKRSPFL